VFHFNELSKSEGNKPNDSCSKSKREVLSDSSLEGQKQMPASQEEQQAESTDENELLGCYFGKLLSRLDRAKAYYTLSMANRLYGEQGFPICPSGGSHGNYSLQKVHGTKKDDPTGGPKPQALLLWEYLDGVTQFYHTTVESVDFRGDTEKSRQEINFWVESQCQGKIKELFSKDAINNATVLVLVNAVYFKAKWEKDFDCEKTVDAPFCLSENEKKTVKMMNQKGRFRIGFIEELQAQILEMKYTMGKLSMLVLLPSCSEDNVKGLQELENKISHEKIMAWSSSENMPEASVAISFPQFVMEDSYDLNSILQDMGIKDIFDETKADLTGISKSSNLYLSKIVHKSIVEVDEIDSLETIMDSLGAVTAQFGFDLFKELHKTNDGNVFFSPVGISTAIGMILLGTRGATASELQKVLYCEKGTRNSRITSAEKEGDPCLPPFFSSIPNLSQSMYWKIIEKTEEIYDQFQKLLTEISKSLNDYELNISNRLFGEKTYLFLQKYIDYVEKYYHASLEPVDFVNAADESRKKINSWVESHTNEKVKNLFPEGSFNSSTKLVLINTVYFKGLWDREFKKEHTKEEEFWLNKNTSKPVQMMMQCSSFSFTLLEDLQAKIVGIPYKNSDLSMFVLLPNDVDGLEKIIDKLSPEKLVEWTSPGHLEQRRVDLRLPHMQVEESYELEPMLKAMGMSTAFSEHGDYSGMSARSGLHAQKFLHRSFMVVTEEGVEAAAGTGLNFTVSAAGCELVHCNHPFLFFIRHRESDSILFFGRFSSP
ncbi:hypothetical protein STEG23_029396, partial [Scotinomys teguina]